MLARKKLILCLLFIFVQTSICQVKDSGQVIVLFIKPLPKKQQDIFLEPSIFHPGRIHKKTIKKMIHHIKQPYVFALYGGNIGVTDEKGEIIFPRKTQQPKINIFVTKNPEPHFQAGLSNILFWRVPRNEDVSRTIMTREKDPKTNITYWESTPATILDQRILPLHSIILLTDPKNIYIPEGITPASDSPHFILPTIYVKPTINPFDDALYAINKKLFFAPVRMLYKKDKQTTMQLLDLTHKGMFNEATNSF
jgi:hypothetical protein